MTINILITTGTEAPAIRATAYSKDTAGVFIDASTIDQAYEAIEDGKQLALEAMDAWEPAPIQDKPAADPAQEAADNKYMKKLQAAEKFTEEHDKPSRLKGKDVFHLCRTAEENIFKSIYNSYDLGFKYGYEKAQKALRQSTSKEDKPQSPNRH